MIRFRAGAVATLLSLLLVACGGGGAASTPSSDGEATTPESAATSESAEPAKSGSARLGRGTLSVAFVPTEMTIEFAACRR